MTHEWREFAQPTELAETLAADIAELLRRAIAERSQATLVLSGGRTPLRLFRALSAQALHWPAVTVIPADERWVPEHDPASNIGMLRRELCQGAAAALQLVSLKTSASDARSGQAEANARLAALNLPLDVLVLGMGDDGHTASLFPDAPELAAVLASQQYCEATHPASQPTARMTLTPQLLNAARHRFLHMEGEGKRAVFDQANTGDDVLRMPIRIALSGCDTPLQTYWAP